MEKENKTRADIGSHLRQIREAKGLSSYRVSMTGGIASGVVKAIEDGSTSYTIDSLLGYLKGCGLKIEIVPDEQ